MNNNEMLRKINKSETDIVELNEQLDKKANELDLEVERNRINNIVKNEGTTVNDLELQDIREGADGITYGSAGDAVREQNRIINKKINYNVELDYSDNIVKGKFIDKNGIEVVLNGYNYVKMLKVNGLYSVTIKNIASSGNACAVSYDKNGNVLGKINVSNWTPSTETIILNEDVYYISVSFSNDYPLSIQGNGIKYEIFNLKEKIDNVSPYNVKNTTIIWIDDDSDKVGIEYVYSACINKGVNATLACLSKKISEDTTLKTRLLEMEEQGLEMALHGYTHENSIWSNDNFDSKSIISNITKGYREMKDFQNYRHLVTPNGANSDMIKSIAKRFSPCLVSAWEGVNKKEWGDKARYDLGRYWMTNHTLEEFKTVIDGLRPKNDLLILATHSAPSVAPWDAVKIEAMLQYVKDSGYNIVTLSEGINYFYS